MLKVSVVIPSYNYGRYLGEAIQSVLGQTYQNFEIIVVDDGSTDDTRDVVAGFSDTRVKYIYQENQGASSAQNTGIKASRGEYVAILGADDIWLPENLETKVKILEDSPEAGIVCSDVELFDDKTGSSLGRFWREDKVHAFVDPERAASEPLRELLKQGTFIAPQSTLIRRSVFSEVGYFDTSLVTFEDWDLFIRILLKFQIKIIDLPLVRIRRHGENLGLNDSKMLLGHAAALLKALHYYPLGKNECELVKNRLKILRPALLREGRRALEIGRRDYGRKLLKAYLQGNHWHLKPYLRLAFSCPIPGKDRKNQPSQSHQLTEHREIGRVSDTRKIGSFSGKNKVSAPKVSVIIPNYNYGRYLGEAIQSVLDQTLPDFEIIVVDDGSTDNSREVVESFTDSRIKYIYQENSGVAAAQNTGVKSSRGEYIAFLGADDLYLPQSLELRAKLLDSNPDVALVSSDVSFFKEPSGEIMGRLWHDVPAHYKFDIQEATREPLKHMIAWGCFIYPQGAMIRRIVFPEIGYFNESFVVCEDWDLFLQIVQHFPIKTIDMALARIRKHDVSLTANLDRMYHGETTTLHQLLQRGSLPFEEKMITKTKLANMHLLHGRQALRSGKLTEGRKALMAAVKLRPLLFKAYLHLGVSLFGKKAGVLINFGRKCLGSAA